MIDKEVFNRLSAIHEPHCITMIGPNYGDDRDRINLKNLSKQVAEMLEEDYAMSTGDVSKVLEPLSAISSDKFNGKSFCIFLYDGHVEVFDLTIELQNKIYIADHLYLAPLLNGFKDETELHVLMISANAVRLLTANAGRIWEHSGSALLPQQLEDAVGYDIEQKALQFRSGHGETGSGLYHAHGSGSDEEHKEELKKFLYKIDQQLLTILGDQTTPLVLAGVDYITAMYKGLSDYKYIHEDSLSGNFDHPDYTDIKTKTDQILAHASKEKLAQLMDSMDEVLSIQKSSISPSDIIGAALEGRVKTLVLDKKKELWGAYHEKEAKTTFDPEKTVTNASLINLAAVHTVKNGGEVIYAEEDMIPEHAEMICMFRFAYSEPAMV